MSGTKNILYAMGAIILVALAVWVYKVGQGNIMIDGEPIATSTEPIPNTSTSTAPEPVISYSPESASSSLRNLSPGPNSKIKSPLVMTGEARGNWMFEATFPITVVDWDGRIIGEGYATAKSDWMTTDFVPFEGRVDFKKPEYAGPQSLRGAIIISNANPSGLSQNDAAAEIPIIFE